MGKNGSCDALVSQKRIESISQVVPLAFEGKLNSSSLVTENQGYVYIYL